MAITKSQLKRLLLVGLGPEAVCTLVGVIIGIITYRDETAAIRPFSEHLVKWIFRVNAGAVAHQLAWLIVLRSLKLEVWDEPVNLKTIWKPTVLGVFLTFVFIFLLNKGYELPIDAIIMMFVQVVAICIVVHIFLFQFGFYSRYSTFRNSKNKVDRPSTLSSNSSNSEGFISLNFNERIEKVNLDQVSHIKVEDHYCTVVYLKENSWQQWTVYGKLKTYEKEYSNRLLRLNRSVLANPDMVAKIEKNSGKHMVTMKGDPEAPFTLSSSQKHLLDHLVPVVE